MDHSALQGRTLARLVDEVQSLLTDGESVGQSLRALDAPRDAGLWSEQSNVVVASADLMALVDRLPSPAEALPAVFSLVDEVRAAWLRIVRARLREMGDRNAVAALAEAVTSAGALGSELVRVSDPSLAPTSFGDLERAVLPAISHEAPAFPVMLRALAATASLVGRAPAAARALAPVAWDDPSVSFVPGRLLLPPRHESVAPSSGVLSGGLEDKTSEADSMRWALRHPWAFLLAQMAFTKEAWEAERVSGGIAFELEPAHAALFQSPPRVEVVVTLPTGEEVRCGSLGEFTQRTLAQLGVTVLAHRLSAASLDDRLAAVVDALVRRDVWRFEHGSGARRPGYSIHGSFSDACYRALGSRAFYRLGAGVTAAVRGVAETWARDRVARAGAPRVEATS